MASRRAGAGAPARFDERGFSLMEVLVATVIATLAVIGLAHSFGLGRSFINRFEVWRAALAEVQARMETLSVEAPTSGELALGIHPPSSIPFVYQGQTYGQETWFVELWNDPATAGTADMKRVTAQIALDSFGVRDTVRLTQLFPTK